MLIQLLIILVIVGAVLYLLKLVPIDQTIKTIIYVIVIVAVVVYLLKTFAVGLLP
jgi:hypothetical protein